MWRNLRCREIYFEMWKNIRCREISYVEIFRYKEKHNTHCFVVRSVLLPCMLFCRKICSFEIYAVLLQNLFCRDWRTFYVEKNWAQNFVRGEKMTNIMWDRQGYFWIHKLLSMNLVQIQQVIIPNSIDYMNYLRYFHKWISREYLDIYFDSSN